VESATATLILWGHALAALLFGALALAEHRREHSVWPRQAFVAALALTALWALAVAGIGPRDVSTRLTEASRNVAWLWVASLLAQQLGGRRATLSALYTVVGVVTIAVAMLGIADDPSFSPAVLDAVETTRRICCALAIIGSLLLLHHLAWAAKRRGDVQLLVLGLAGMWGIDLATTTVALSHGDWPASIVAVRGGIMAGIALLIAAAAQRGVDGTPMLSRTIAWRTMAIAAVLLYAGFTALIARAAEAAFGANGRLAETAVVFGATAALLTLASSSWLRAWARVMVAKHLFQHRYDYRVEWQRFAATLGSPGDGAEPLPVRIVRAIADLTDSPAGLLLVADEDTMTAAAEWNWPNAPDAGGIALRRHLATTGRIVAVHDNRFDEDAANIPAGLMADSNAWIIVPLLHADVLAGAIVLAKPPVDRQLDWEDLDLLRVAGRQAASYLAEDRAHAALAEAARFREFNRRFAFLLHDIKNVASQLTLVARNAERHADNPEFRADMVATLRESAERMTTLLARLGEHDASRPELAQPVDLAGLARRVAHGRRAQHGLEVEIEHHAIADAQPARLEQVLGHLVQNAVDAGGADPVRIVVREAGNRVAIAVIDRGEGMSAPFVQAELFRPFVSTKPGGFGIGAYEARELVRRMGGEIRVESRVGEGSIFTVLLPPAPVLEQAA
jgi:putative PEP-CTERM system histidine kinase